MVLVNGVATDSVPAADRGLAYGDGVFRTMSVRDGAPEHWARHYDKLATDCAALDLSCPNESLLRDEARRTCATSRGCALKIIVTRGSSGRGYRAQVGVEPTRILLTFPLPDYPSAYAEEGVQVRRCRLRLAYQPVLAGVKHLNRLENVLARSEWSEPSIAEGVLCDIEDNAICGTMTNLFIGAHGQLATPKLDRCGVAGVTRDRVIAAAAREATPCEIGDLSWARVLDADELFLVNSLAGVWPVREIEGRARSPGALTRAAQRWLGNDAHSALA